MRIHNACAALFLEVIHAFLHCIAVWLSARFKPVARLAHSASAVLYGCKRKAQQPAMAGLHSMLTATDDRYSLLACTACLTIAAVNVTGC